MDEMEKSDVYSKLSPERKDLAEKVLDNLKNGTGLWKQGWRCSGMPESGITGKKYHGINNLYLTLIAMERGYTDNRWITYRQMEDRGWSFKSDEDGRSKGKGAGVTIEFFELRDKETKQSFDRHTLDGMTFEERQEYMDKNVYPLRRYYRVFNADVIDGIQKQEVVQQSPSEENERAEKLLTYWSEHESKIIHGGSSAYYDIVNDEVHLPPKESFISMQEYYSAALHETGHSTGHANRLNREIRNQFGSENYAIEELRAQIAAMFLIQELGIQSDESQFKNDSAYIQSWYGEIKENPNYLFTAIADADRIAKFVLEKEKLAESTKEVELFAIKEDEDELGNTIYQVLMCSEHGQINSPFATKFKNKEELQKGLDWFRSAPFWTDKEFKEVSIDELQATSILRAQKQQTLEEVGELIPPSEIAARALPNTKTATMEGRGIESLTKMVDRDVVEKASKTKAGEKFQTLYKGGSLFGDEEKDERSLMSRIAMFCNGDKDQLMRIFKSSGQFRDEKPNSFYEQMATQSLQFVSRARSEQIKKVHQNKGRFGANAKT